MVSNESGFGADMAQLGGTIADGAHEVGEYLGLVDGPLIPGDPAQVRTAAEHAGRLAGAFERAGQGFKTIDDGGWYGEAAEAFHGYLDTAAPKWFRAADAFSSAGAALNTYADTLAWAKKQAAQGKKELEAAQARSEAAAEQHKAAQQQAQAGNAPPPPPFADPAAEDKAAAQHSIDAAKKAVASAGREAARAVRAARQDAPAEPGMMAKAVDVGGDVVGGYLDWQKNAVQGGLGAIGGLYQQFRMVNPFDPYTMTHPMQALNNLGTTATGVVSAIANPWQAAKTAVNVDGWKNNPAQTAGSFGPTVLASLAGGSGVAARVSGTIGKLGRAGGKVADDLAAGKPDAPGGRPPASPGSQGPPSVPRPDAPGGHASAQPAGHQGGQSPTGGGAPGGNGPGPSAGQPGVGTPWGNSDLPPTPSHGGTPSQAPGPQIPDYSRPDGGFGPQGSSQPDVAEPPQNYSDGGQRRMPWEFDQFDDGGPEAPSRNPDDEQQQRQPAQEPSPSTIGERDHTQLPSYRDPVSSDARPERHDQPPTPVNAGQHWPDLGTPDPDQRIQDVVDQVRREGDGIGLGNEKWDFQPGTEHLPEGLTRTPSDPYANGALPSPEPNDPHFIHREVDPALEENALWRAAHSWDLNQFFEDGLLPANPQGKADISGLDGHVAGNSQHFVSTSESLEHTVQRVLQRPDDYGVILKMIHGGGIDTDATLRDYIGDGPLGYVSHGEREILLRDGADRAVIEGGYVPTQGPDGKISFKWFDNPNFDPALARGTR